MQDCVLLITNKHGKSDEFVMDLAQGLAVHNYVTMRAHIANGELHVVPDGIEGNIAVILIDIRRPISPTEYELLSNIKATHGLEVIAIGPEASRENLAHYGLELLIDPQNMDAATAGEHIHNFLFQAPIAQQQAQQAQHTQQPTIET